MSVRKDHFYYILRFFQTEKELNSQLSDRVCAILAAQSLRYPLETLRFLMEAHIDDMVRPHMYDDAIAFRLVFDLLINTKSSSALNELNLALESPGVTRRSSDDDRMPSRPSKPSDFHLEAFAAMESYSHNKEHSRSPDKPVQLAISDEGFKIDLLPFEDKEPHNHRFSHGKKSAFNSHGNIGSHATTNSASRNSPNNSVDNLAIIEDTKVYRSLFEFRVATVQKAIDKATNVSDIFMLINIFKIVEMTLREISTIADYKQLMITLFYERKNVMKLFQVVKNSTNSTMFSLWAEIMILLLKIHVDVFGENEKRGQSLQQPFIRSYVDIIEDIKEYLREEDTFFVLPNSQERPVLSFRKLALVKLIRGCLQLNYAQLNLSLSIFSVFTTIYVG